ncbi:MAG: PDZ domain-containing protein, partial [Deltaproteobacteria bacterium]
MPKLPLNRRQLVAAGCLGLAAILLLVLSLGVDARGPHFNEAAAKTDRDGTYDLAKARTLSRVIGHIRAHYVDPQRIDPKEMAVAALAAAQREVPEVMVEVLRNKSGVPTALHLTVDSVEKRFALDRVGDLYELNWKLMDILDFLERNLPPVVDLQELEFACINGVLSTLDPHSLLLSPRVYREMQLGQKGRFGGLGIVVGMEDGLLNVQSVMRDTPAAEADIKAGDDIVQIDTESTVNMSLDEAVNLLRGEPGSRVTLWIKREGWKVPRPHPLVRREIRVPSVEWESLPDNLGYVQIHSFQDNTVDNLHEALAALRARKGGLAGLVIDLRDNPGGLLDKAIGVSDTFLDHGTIVTTVREGAREREESHATHADTVTDVPLVVLINRGSASASEIVAGALKRNDRAMVIGERSFGKGSVQVVYKIDEAALKLTIAQYLTPGDVSIQSVGIVPDVEIQALRADRELLDLYPDSEDERGEAGLQSHLDSTHTQDVRPSVKLRVVADPAPHRDDKPTAAERANDPLGKLAQELLLAAQAPNRKQALVQAAGYLKQRQAAEEARLTEHLRAMGVDWAGGPNPKKPSLKVRIRVTPVRADGGKGATDALLAGESARVEVEVLNAGKAPVFRIHGRLLSALSSVDGTELAFGKIEPGRSVRRTATLRLPRSTAATGDDVRMQLLADDVDLGPEGDAYVSVTELPRPLFAHTSQVLDPEGNGDGLIERGETIHLAVRVKNVGPGRAHRVIASVKNESGQDVFITEGRQELGELDPEQTKVARFGLKVRETLKARMVHLKLTIYDQALKVWSTDDVSLRVFPEGFPARQAKRGVVVVGDAEVPVRSGAHRDAPEVGVAAARAVVA